MATGIEVWPSLAEFYIYDETIYRLLAGDARRNAAYRNAFKKVLNGKTVVEIGPGSELVLSRLCLEAGAKKVYAIELLEETYLQARRQIASLGLEDRIALIHGDARRVGESGLLRLGDCRADWRLRGVGSHHRRLPAVPARSGEYAAGAHLDADRRD